MNKFALFYPSGREKRGEKQWLYRQRCVFWFVGFGITFHFKMFISACLVKKCNGLFYVHDLFCQDLSSMMKKQQK